MGTLILQKKKDGHTRCSYPVHICRPVFILFVPFSMRCVGLLAKALGCGARGRVFVGLRQKLHFQWKGKKKGSQCFGTLLKNSRFDPTGIPTLHVSRS